MNKMTGNFKYDWLRKSPGKNLGVPKEYNPNNFVNWEKKFSFFRNDFIKGGGYGNVYSVNNSLVAKTFKVTPKVKEGFVFGLDDEIKRKVPFFLEREFILGSRLYNSGVSVPKHWGLFLVYDSTFGEYLPAIIMERIKNVSIKNLRVSEQEYLGALRDLEMEKAESKGFIPGDDSEGFGNYLYSKKEDKVYLIDFMFWGVR